MEHWDVNLAMILSENYVYHVPVMLSWLNICFTVKER